MSEHGAVPFLPVDAHSLNVAVLLGQIVGADDDLLAFRHLNNCFIVPEAGEIVQVLPRLVSSPICGDNRNWPYLP